MARCYIKVHEIVFRAYEKIEVLLTQSRWPNS